jgi:hypothetical protein
VVDDELPLPDAVHERSVKLSRFGSGLEHAEDETGIGRERLGIEICTVLDREFVEHVRRSNLVARKENNSE